MRTTPVLIDWFSDKFGDPATCVHESSTGSWLADHHSATSGE